MSLPASCLLLQLFVLGCVMSANPLEPIVTAAHVPSNLAFISFALVVALLSALAGFFASAHASKTRERTQKAINEMERFLLREWAMRKQRQQPSSSEVKNQATPGLKEPEKPPPDVIASALAILATADVKPPAKSTYEKVRSKDVMPPAKMTVPPVPDTPSRSPSEAAKPPAPQTTPPPPVKKPEAAPASEAMPKATKRPHKPLFPPLHSSHNSEMKEDSDTRDNDSAFDPSQKPRGAQPRAPPADKESTIQKELRLTAQERERQRLANKVDTGAGADPRLFMEGNRAYTAFNTTPRDAKGLQLLPQTPPQQPKDNNKKGLKQKQEEASGAAEMASNVSEVEVLAIPDSLPKKPLELPPMNPKKPPRASQPSKKQKPANGRKKAKKRRKKSRKRSSDSADCGSVCSLKSITAVQTISQRAPHSGKEEREKREALQLGISLAAYRKRKKKESEHKEVDVESGSITDDDAPAQPQPPRAQPKKQKK